MSLLGKSETVEFSFCVVGECIYNSGVLKQQLGSPDWGQQVADILRLGMQRPKKGHDAGDHPPITPMKSATEAELGHEAWRLYDYITRHFIASVSVHVLLTFSPAFYLSFILVT